MASATLELACDLIARPSVTPEDFGCQALLIQRLEALGFHCQSLRFGAVDNLWAQRGTAKPLFLFAGHTDVVPPGPLTQWTSPPFEPTIREGQLFGRGAADMKGSLAAMVTACERFISNYSDHNGSIAFLITSDEEGPAVDGTRKVVEWLTAQGREIDYCLVGEPSSSERIGDVVKNGRRGSLNGNLVVHGTQGHVAYPQLADNPLHRLAPAMSELCATEWDQGNAHFPATTFQISNIHAGSGTTNVIPGEVGLLFNFRFSTESTAEALQQRVETLLERHKLNYTLEWSLSGAPFLTAEGTLVEAVQKAITDVTGQPTQLSTAGGTSDGRFIAPTGAEVVELGPLNRTIHKVNESVSVNDLETLSILYERTLESIFEIDSVG